MFCYYTIEKGVDCDLVMVSENGDTLAYCTGDEYTTAGGRWFMGGADEYESFDLIAEWIDRITENPEQDTDDNWYHHVE